VSVVASMSSTVVSIVPHVVSILPTLRKAVLIGGGGAAIAKATDSVLQFPIGANKPAEPEEKILGFPITPEGKSVLFMTIAMAFHYLGYSLARPITVALFTSSATGYAGFAAAFPFAMAFVSPMALLLLMGYGGLLDVHGPRGALIRSTAYCSFVVSAAAVAIGIFDSTQIAIAGIPAVKFITGPLFVFRESYVQLLTSQFWSFMASSLTPSQSARWFGPIAGLTSIASAVAGVSVSPIVDKVGLSGALLGTGITLLLSLLFSNLAYEVAQKYGFEPTDHTKAKKSTFGKNAAASSKQNDHSTANMLKKASSLFARVPVLKALFFEILASQGLATVLNVAFVARLGTAIPDDAKRAGWVGVFFALINIITMVLQFAILPPLMTLIEPRDLWRAVPVISLLCTAFQAAQKNPSLYVVSASLLVMKVSEYSARRMLDEMVFVPLDFESRFVGKEVIGVFGYRFGKSLMSLALSGLTQLAGDFGIQELSTLSTLVAVGWMRTAWKLSNLVPTREEAEAVYAKEQKKGGGRKRVPSKRR